MQWNYFINLCGQDFPLKTVTEIGAYLKGLGNYNSIESVRLPPNKRQRYQKVHHIVDTQGEYAKSVRPSYESKPPPPFGMELFAGSVYG